MECRFSPRSQSQQFPFYLMLAIGQIEMEWNIQERESLGFPSFFQIHWFRLISPYQIPIWDASSSF